jgi:hypothetical protein
MDRASNTVRDASNCFNAANCGPVIGGKSRTPETWLFGAIEGIALQTRRYL